MNTELVKGTQFKGPQFVAMGDGKMSDVKVAGTDGFVFDAEYVTVSKINEFGVNYKDVIWFDIPDEEDPTAKMLYGWYQWDGEEDPIDCNDDALVAGECLMVQAQEDAVGFNLVNAGEVAMNGVAVKLVKGTQFLASATPIAAMFGDVIVSGYTSDIDAEYVTISKINEFGVNYKDVIWFDITDEEDPTAKMLYGWYQWDGEEDPVDCNEDKLAPGDGLMVQAQEDAVGWTITFPAIAE